MTHYISNPTLNAVYQAWQRHRDANPQGALRVVEVYAQVHGVPARDLLRHFAEAEASQAPQAAPEAHGGPSGEGAGTPTPPRFGGLYGPSEAGGGPFRQPRPGRDSRRATI